MVAATAFLINSDLDGPFNLTAPNPVRNSELVGGLARLLKRPAVIPVPKFALRLAVGELAGEALGGQCALPARLSAAGFEFRHPTLDEALRARSSAKMRFRIATEHRTILRSIERGAGAAAAPHLRQHLRGLYGT